MKRLLLLLLSTPIFIIGYAQEIKVSNGSIVSFKDFPSKYVAARNVDVWLPDGYTTKKRYAVLYMHDGQMLFDSTNNWAHQEWGVDETMGRLLADKKIKDCIVVGVWNSGAQRHTDYFPQKPFEALTQYQRDTLYKAKRGNNASIFSGTVHSDKYLAFLVKELKPFIDSAFSVKKDRANTFIAGSSMGGLISMYAICEYPDVYGGAACLSTHWPGIFTNINNPIPDAFLYYLSKHMPSSKNHKLYFDFGTKTLDTLYQPHQTRADAIIRAGGYNDSNFMTKMFEGASHNEQSWAKRLEIPVLFLLKK
ncbi:alpha/beta hydrolase [Parasediminibacterium sp. JCM 36343]|uniref:alpha/beta hydrolase n=1 Tax=Parasediminibacterium sp. JCM 36343 TaxID=3374279 RepID=UPI00397B483F